MKNKFLLNLFLTLFTSLIVFNGCKNEDDPLSPSEEHFEAIGMVVYDASGKQVLKILRGVTSDTLSAPVGVKSDHFTVKFIDERERLVEPTDDPDHKFAYKVDDETVATIWQHPGKEGWFEFHINGIKIGKTYVEFFIEHEGHNDYRTGKIPVAIK